MRAWRLLWPVLGPLMPKLGAAYACMVAYALATASLAFLLGPTVAFMFRGTLPKGLGDASMLARTWPSAAAALGPWLSPARAATWLPALLVSVAVLKGLAQLGQLTLMSSISQKVLEGLRARAFARTLRQPPAFFARWPHGEVQSRLTFAGHQIEQALFDGLGPLLRDSLSVLALLAFCAISDLCLATYLLVGVPLVAWPLAIFTRRLKRSAGGVQAAAGALSAVLDEAVAGVQVVQAFGGQAREEARLARAARAYRRAARRSHLIRALRSPTLEGLAVAMVAVLVVRIARQVREVGADPGHYVSFFAAVAMMYDPIKKLGYVGEYLAQGAAALERMFALVEAPPEVASPPGAPSPAPLARALAFSDVTFAYPGARPALAGLDLEVPAGQCVALVGESGAGKTTVAALALRFWDVDGGAITWDGTDIRALDLDGLRRQVAWVGQDVFLFAGTVADNVAYGRPGARRAEVEAACHAALAHAFIARLPGAYDHVIGARGGGLSGGQRQRLALARALLCEASLFVFDEATSHLDVLSERALHRALAPAVRGRTALLIAHRLSTVAHADAVAVVAHGRVVERGTHAELLAAGGAYARLCAADAARPGPASGAGHNKS